MSSERREHGLCRGGTTTCTNEKMSGKTDAVIHMTVGGMVFRSETRVDPRDYNSDIFSWGMRMR